MKIKPVDYIIPKVVKTTEEAIEVASMKLKRRLWTSPKFQMQADVFENTFGLLTLPKNSWIDVQGVVKKPMNLDSGGRVIIHADSFRNNLTLNNRVKLFANRVFGALKLTGSSKAEIRAVKGNISTYGDSSAFITKLKGDLSAAGNSHVEVFSMQGDVGAVNKAAVHVRDFEGLKMEAFADSTINYGLKPFYAKLKESGRAKIQQGGFL